jgi:hypothetical protein
MGEDGLVPADFINRSDVMEILVALDPALPKP